MTPPPFYKRLEFWTAVLTPIIAALWPAVIIKLPWLATLTTDQVTIILAGGLVALITGVGLFTYGSIKRNVR